MPGSLYAMMYGLEKYGKMSAKVLLEPIVDRARNLGWIVGRIECMPLSDLTQMNGVPSNST